ncbi:MAG: hypothetical protein HPKKFMNG_00732 [Planctomycetes bacterium]|nr:hypothetical protein [Planctomycetota bacterium]
MPALARSRRRGRSASPSTMPGSSMTFFCGRTLTTSWSLPWASGMWATMLSRSASETLRVSFCAGGASALGGLGRRLVKMASLSVSSSLWGSMITESPEEGGGTGEITACDSGRSAGTSPDEGVSDTRLK